MTAARKTQFAPELEAIVRTPRLEAAESALLEGLGPQREVCRVSLEGDPKAPSFFIRAHGAEWAITADMVPSQAFQTGERVAGMAAAAGERKATATNGKV